MERWLNYGDVGDSPYLRHLRRPRPAVRRLDRTAQAPLPSRIPDQCQACRRRSPAGGEDWQDVPEAWRRALDTATDAAAVPASGNWPAVAGESVAADLLRFSSGSDRSRAGAQSRVTAHAPRHRPGAGQATPSLPVASITTSLSAVSVRWTYWEGRAGLANPPRHRQVAQPRSSGDCLPPPPEIAAKLQQVLLELTRASTGPSGHLEHSLASAASRIAADKAGQTTGRLPVGLAMASNLRAPGAQAKWTLEIRWTPSPSAAPIQDTTEQTESRRPGRTPRESLKTLTTPPNPASPPASRSPAAGGPSPR